MAQLYRDFTEYALGDSIANGDITDIELHADAIGYPSEIIEYDVSESGRAMHLQRGGFTDSGAWTFPELDGLNPSQGEVYTEYAGYNDDDHRVLRFGGCSHVGGDNWYGASHRANHLRTLFRVDNGEPTTLADGEQVGSTDANRLMCLRYQWDDDGTTVTLRMKSWYKDTPEPSTWSIETTDSAFAGLGGKLGWTVNSNANRQTAMCFVGIGTDGDPAPTEPVSAGPTTPTNLTTTDITADSFRAGWTA